MRVVWQAPAEDELNAAIDYYLLNAGHAVASDFKIEVRRVTSRLREHPEIGIRIRHQSRRFPLDGYPYSLIYHLERDALVIVALAHQRRRPEYWSGRR